MPKPKSCNASVAALIRKHGLAAVQAAVEMAVELAREPVKQRQVAKKKVSGAVPLSAPAAVGSTH